MTTDNRLAIRVTVGADSEAMADIDINDYVAEYADELRAQYPHRLITVTSGAGCSDAVYVEDDSDGAIEGSVRQIGQDVFQEMCERDEEEPIETCGKLATAPYRAPFICGLDAGHDGEHHG